MNADKRLEVFARGSDGQLWHNWERKPNTELWAQWTPLGGQLIGSPVAGQNADGRLEVFAQQDDHTIGHIWQTKPAENDWSAWEAIDAPITATPAVVLTPDGRLDVFFNSVGDQVRHVTQTAPSANSWAMDVLEGNFAATAPAAARNQDDRLETFYIGVDKDITLYNDWQTSPNGPWLFGGHVETGLHHLQGSPCAVRNLDGRLEVFALDTDNNMKHAWQQHPSEGPWEHASLDGGGLPTGAKLAELGVRMAVFFMD